MKCKECKFCKAICRSQSQCFEPGRKHYYCEYPGVKTPPNRTEGFIDFGSNTLESPINIKTSPRWCPLRNRK